MIFFLSPFALFFDFCASLFGATRPKAPARQPARRWETLLDMGAR